LLFRWTNEVIGKDDPEYRRPGESPGQTIKRARGELRAYLGQLIERRRSDPEDDLVSELINGTVDGAPLTQEQLVSYCELLVEAGNETTRNAVSGGVLAFSQHPDQWAKLRERPELLSDAVDEILRWVSPISHFTRVATEDCEVGGVAIRAGEQVGPVRVPSRSSPQPPPRVRVRGALLHGCPPGARRAGNDLQAPAHPRGVVRGLGPRGAPAIGSQRKHQAPAAPVPTGVRRASEMVLFRSEIDDIVFCHRSFA